jgi:RHS repeat-associated protein
MQRIHYTFVLSICFSLLQLVAFGQTNESGFKASYNLIPKSPEAASIVKFIDFPVGHYTGTPQVNFPLASIEEQDKVMTSVSLSYHAAGNRVADIPEAVGLGWRLHGGGAITRQVYGLPDDATYCTGFLALRQTKSYTAVENDFYSNNSSLIEPYALGQLDTEPDEFYFSVNGYEGKFAFDWTGSMPVLLSASPIKISNFTQTGGKITSWEMVDGFGVTYTFDAVESTTAGSLTGARLEGSCNGPHSFNSAWYLTKITSPTTSYYISFEYDDYSYTKDNHQIFETCTGQGQGQTLLGCPNYYIAPNQNNVCYDGSSAALTYSIAGKRLKRIVNASGKFEILLNAPTDRTDGPTPGSVNNFKRIESIVYNVSGALMTKYNLAYAYQGGRLMLQSLEEEGRNGEKVPKYTFAYNGGVLQNYDSKAIDYWGYQNNNTTNRTTPYFYGNFGGQVRLVPGADRNPDLSGTKAQVLEKITYPNGGNTEFIYELNDCSYIGDNSTVADKPQYSNTTMDISRTAIGSTPSWTVSEQQITINNYEALCFIEVYGSTWAFYNGAQYLPQAYIKNSSGTIIHSWQLNIVDFSNCYEPCFSYFYQDLFLQPGTYTVGCKARKFPGSAGDDNVTINMQYSQVNPAPPLLKQAVGGLRVKEVKAYDPLQNQTLTKKYEYTDETTSGYSSGVIYNDPINTYARKLLYYPNNGTSCFYGDCNYTDVVGASRIAVGGTSGSHIGYRRVAEIIGTTQQGGKIVYNFSSPKEHMDILNTIKPFGRPETQSYKTGLLKQKRLYDQNNNLVQQEDIQYAFKEQSINAAKIGIGNYDRGFGGNPGSVCSDPYEALPAFEKFAAWWAPLKMGFAQTQSRTLRQYYNAGANYTELITDYAYDQQLQLLKSTTTKDLSIGYEWLQQITYPRDYACPSACTSSDPAMQTILEMNARNFLAYPIEQTTWLKKAGFTNFRLLKAQLIEYGAYGGYHNIQPKSLHELYTTTPLTDFTPSSRNGANQLVKDTRYIKENSYIFDNTTRKIKEQYREVTGWDVRDQYIWGHERRVPVAYVENANANEIAYSGFEEVGEASDKNGNWTLNSPGGGWTSSNGDVAVGHNAYYIGPGKSIVATSLPAGNYIVSFWHKDGNIAVNGNTVSMTGGTWKYHEMPLTLTGSTVTVTGSDWATLIDELRLHPADAVMRTFSYEDDRMLLRSITNEQGMPAHAEYDDLHRLKANRDIDRNIRQTYEYVYASPGTAINYVKTRAILSPTQDFGTAIALTGSNVIGQFSTFDGLGRMAQANRVAQSPTGKDVIAPVQYDAIGRPYRQYLPYTNTTNGGLYRSAALTEQSTFANTFGAGGYGYAETQYDNSPLNRPLAQSAPGASWHMGTANKMTYAYRANTAADAVRNLFGSSDYAANTLNVVEESDENGKKRMSFTDKIGRTVLVRQQLPATLTGNASTDWANTYTAYDDFGRVAAVMPPETSLRMRNSGNWDYTNSTYASTVYRYQYDARGRMTSKTVPSGGTTTLAYDRLDRVVLATDPKGFKTFSRYDKLNRPVLTGRYKGTATPGTTEPLFETPNTTAPHHYSSTSFPTDNNIDVYKVIYYDDYDLDNNGSLGTTETYTNPGETFAASAHLWQRGKPTATKTAILKNDGTAPTTYLMTRTYLDRFSNILQIHKQNHLSGQDITSTAYDFANRPTYTRRDHTATPPSGTVKTYAIREQYTYDAAGRLRFTRHHISTTINATTPTANWVVTTAPLYDELERLTDKRLHASNYGGSSALGLGSSFNYLQSLDYTYNIRGWLTGINDVSSCSLQAGDQMEDMFRMRLDYDAPTGGGTAQYNGNISTLQWRSFTGATCLTQQQYRFTYDGANRLTAATHFTNPSGTWVQTNNYTESGISYDLNGNLKTYTRRGLTSGTATFGVIDQLTYTYGDAARPDRLTQVADAGSTTKGFRYNSTAAAYAYDLNGNMTQDNHKALTIAYNHLNLPNNFVISGTGGGTIGITYTADGEKLTKVRESTAATQQYCGGIEYTGSALTAIYHSEGRCTPNGATAFHYEYTLKDHLGNARLNFRAAGATASFLEETHYYPFGMQMEGMGTATTSANTYKYNGKEWNNDLNLGLYDYGARWYDPALGRWSVVDPLTEEFPEWSPYNFVMNNPIRLVDEDGMAPTDIIVKGENNSSVTIKTDLIDVSVNAGSIVGDLGGNYTLQGNHVLIAVLDIVGIVDPTGVADAAAATLEAEQGNYGSAILSGLGVFPLIGDLGKVGKVGKHVKTIEKAIDGAKAQNLKEAAEKGIPKSQLGPSGKPKIHTVSKPNQKQAKDAARNNPKSNTSPVKHSSDKGQKTHYHSTKNGNKMTGKDNVHYENRSSKKIRVNNEKKKI